MEMGNRGRNFEELIAFTNSHYYKNRGVAIIHKVPSEWLPIREKGNAKNKIVSAKIDENKRAAVDFLGTTCDTSIAFDAKSTINEKRWAFNEIKPDQWQFMKDFRRVNPKSYQFVLLGLYAFNRCFVLPFDFLEPLIEDWHRGGRASLPLEVLINSLPSIKLEYPLDYLSLLPRVKP